MLDIAYTTDLFEMIAAIAALGVTVILYLETRSMRSEMRKERAEAKKMLEEMRQLYHLKQ